MAPLAFPAGPPSLQDPNLEAALERIRAERIAAHIRFLADDLLEGRGTGSRGYDIAAKYVATQFEALGLEPAGTGGGYLQPVRFRKSVPIAEQSTLVLSRDGEEQALEYGPDFIARGMALFEETSVSAPVVFAGFGVTATDLNYDDYASIDAAGKIVAMLRGGPPSFPSSERAHFSSTDVKLANAVAHGAAGVIMLWTPGYESRLPWTKLRRLAGRGDMSWVDQEGRPFGAHPELRGLATMGLAGAEKLFAGAPRTLEQVFGAEKGEPSASFDLPVRASLELASEHSQVESPNVIAMLPGSDPELRGEVVVYSAHLDHEGIGEPDPSGDAIYNGAYDNASGVAAILEIARAFSGLRPAPRRSILFVATAAEEEGLLGAEYFAHHPTVARAAIVANINCDGNLMLYAPRDVIAYGAEHSSLGAAVERAAARLNLTVTPDPFPEQTLFIRSDQYPFIKQGIPAVFIVAGPHSADPKIDGGAALGEWIQSIYHTPKDDVSQPMRWETGVLYAQVNFLVGYQVAMDAERPSWHPHSFFARNFGDSLLNPGFGDR